MGHIVVLKGLGMLCIVALAVPGSAQERGATKGLVDLDPLIESVQESAGYVSNNLAEAADQMSEADYAFRPTPETRSFGQILAHLADANYRFCSAVIGESAPVHDIEQTATARVDIQRALAESEAYCDRAHAALSEAGAQTPIEFMGGTRPALAVLILRTQHSFSHYGNIATYMRLRGKEPPSSRSPTE